MTPGTITTLDAIPVNSYFLYSSNTPGGLYKKVNADETRKSKKLYSCNVAEVDSKGNTITNPKPTKGNTEVIFILNQ